VLLEEKIKVVCVTRRKGKGILCYSKESLRLLVLPDVKIKVFSNEVSFTQRKVK
jgi:hypothetical protein